MFLLLYIIDFLFRVSLTKIHSLDVVNPKKKNNLFMTKNNKKKTSRKIELVFILFVLRER
jgi:hypothetical protein